MKMNKEEASMVEEKETENKAPDLSIQDLASLRSIIDVAASRGAFQPREMVAIGTVYNKLDAFLEAVAKNQPEQPQQPPQE